VKKKFEHLIVNSSTHFDEFQMEEILRCFDEASTPQPGDEKLVSQKTAEEWREAKKDPPELSTSMKINAVLVVHRNCIKFGWKTEIGWHIEGSPSHWDEEIKYWMPLPKLPE